MIRTHINLHTKISIYDTLNTKNSTCDTLKAHKQGLVEFLEDRDLKKREIHLEATARVDAAVEARGGENTADDKKAAEAIASASSCAGVPDYFRPLKHPNVQQVEGGGENRRRRGRSQRRIRL